MTKAQNSLDMQFDGFETSLLAQDISHTPRTLVNL